MISFIKRLKWLSPEMAADAVHFDLKRERAERDAVDQARRERMERYTESTEPKEPALALARARRSEALEQDRKQAAAQKQSEADGKAALIERYEAKFGTGKAGAYLRHQADLKIERLKADAAANYPTNPNIYRTWIGRLEKSGLADNEAIEVLGRALLPTAAPTAPSTPSTPSPAGAAPSAPPQAKEPERSITPLLDELAMITDPADRTAFFRKHNEALRSEQRKAKAQARAFTPNSKPVGNTHAERLESLTDPKARSAYFQANREGIETEFNRSRSNR